MKSLHIATFISHSLILFRPGGGGGGGWGGGVPTLTLNVYNFFKIQPNAAKLDEFF